MCSRVTQNVDLIFQSNSNVCGQKSFKKGEGGADYYGNELRFYCALVCVLQTPAGRTAMTSL